MSKHRKLISGVFACIKVVILLRILRCNSYFHKMSRSLFAC